MSSHGGKWRAVAMHVSVEGLPRQPPEQVTGERVYTVSPLPQSTKLENTQDASMGGMYIIYTVYTHTYVTNKRKSRRMIQSSHIIVSGS